MAPINDFRQVVKRIQTGYVLIAIVILVFVARLFYVQVIHYGYYRAQALSDQLKQYEIPANRGIIEAHQGNTIVPIVLNQTLYTLFADPTLVKDPSKTANTITKV